MLEVRNVSKVYQPPTGWLRIITRAAAREPVEALGGISFTAPRGRVVGIVGPNGAGKSTLIRIIANLVEPSAGAVTVDGQSVATARTTPREIGLLLGDDRALYWRLTGRQNLEFFGAMAGLDASTARERADQLLGEVGLGDRDRRVFGYSSGMRVQLGIARAMIHEPALLVLDEPSRSLDPVASEVLLTQLRHYADNGGSVLLSSHRLDEVESLCDDVLVIIGGQQRYWGPTSELKAGAKGPSAALRDILIEASTE